MKVEKIRQKIKTFFRLYLFDRKLTTWKLLCLANPHQERLFTLVDGSRISCLLNSAIGRGLYTQKFESSEIKFVIDILKPGNVVFDIGANVGVYTITMAKIVGESGHVYAFEPGERELKTLKDNIALNNIKNVTVIEAAVSNKVGVSDFAISHDGAMNSLTDTGHPLQDIETWTSVKTITLDSFVAENNIKMIDFIKIDVEGAEKLVIEGASKTIKDMNTCIMFEAGDTTSPAFGYTPYELMSLFRSLDFEVFHLGSKGLEQTLNSSTLSRQIYNFFAFKKLNVKKVY